MTVLYIILTLASFVTVFTLLVCWTARDRKLPDTVSNMAYGHPERKRRLHYTLWLWSATFTLTPALFNLIPEAWEGMAHAYATSVVLCGLMPLFFRKRNLPFVTFGLSAGVFSQCCVCVLCPWWMLVWTHIGAVVAFAERQDAVPSWLSGKGLLVIEFVSWFNIASAILTRLIVNL